MANPSSERPFTGFYGQNSETNYQEEAAINGFQINSDNSSTNNPFYEAISNRLLSSDDTVEKTKKILEEADFHWRKWGPTVQSIGIPKPPFEISSWDPQLQGVPLKPGGTQATENVYPPNDSQIIDWQTLINATSNGFSKSVFDLATSSTDILRMCLNNSCIPSTIPELEKELVAAVNIGLTPNVYETWYAKRFGFQQSTIFNNTNTTNAVPHATGTETIPNYLAGSSQSTSECLTAKANSFINQLNVNYHYQQTNDINQNELENYRIQNIPENIFPDSLHPAGAERGSSRKRPRQIYGPRQLAALKNEFAQQRYIGRERMSKLAEELGLTPEQIRVWFQNRRQKNPVNGDQRSEGMPGDEDSTPEEMLGSIEAESSQKISATVNDQQQRHISHFQAQMEDVLEMSFNIDNYPDNEKQCALAKHLKISKDQVTRWFENRRNGVISLATLRGSLT